MIGTVEGMEVGIRELRAHLSRFVERAQAGEQILVTDRGIPVARLVAAGGQRPLDRLIETGVVEPAPRRQSRPPETPLRAAGTVSDVVLGDRR